MTQHERLVLTLRWGVFTAALTALFWGIWYIATGRIPEANVRWIPGGNGIHISRLWDILVGPVAAYTVLRILAIPAVTNAPKEFLHLALIATMTLAGPIASFGSLYAAKPGDFAPVYFCVPLCSFIPEVVAHVIGVTSSPIILVQAAASCFAGAAMAGFIGGIPAAAFTLVLGLGGAVAAFTLCSLAPIFRFIRAWLTVVH